MYGVKKKDKGKFLLTTQHKWTIRTDIQKLGAIILKIGGSDKQVAMRDLCTLLHLMLVIFSPSP